MWRGVLRVLAASTVQAFTSPHNFVLISHPADDLISYQND
jgi:hypothetical protein